MYILYIPNSTYRKIHTVNVVHFAHSVDTVHTVHTYRTYRSKARWGRLHQFISAQEAEQWASVARTPEDIDDALHGILLKVLRDCLFQRNG